MIIQDINMLDKHEAKKVIDDLFGYIKKEFSFPVYVHEDFDTMVKKTLYNFMYVYGRLGVRFIEYFVRSKIYELELKNVGRKLFKMVRTSGN
ncbi:MAG: hypothetical protein QXI58_06820 [Candidatus Micrarchaeia archaeon]